MPDFFFSFLTRTVSWLLASLLLLPACQQGSGNESGNVKEVVLSPEEQHREFLQTTQLHDSTVTDILTEYGKLHPETMVLIKTDLGDIRVRLYEDTPLHRANFIRLAKRGFYDQSEFYRVMKDFMIQGGDYEGRTMKIGGYRIPPEMQPHHFHKRGALAMARYSDDNPESKSSSHNFYIVQGVPRSRAEVLFFGKENGLNYTPDQIQTYTTLGGEPSLDQVYTVFGEVEEGLDVVERISNVEVDKQKWPLKTVRMTMEVLDRERQ